MIYDLLSVKSSGNLRQSRYQYAKNLRGLKKSFGTVATTKCGGTSQDSDLDLMGHNQNTHRLGYFSEEEISERLMKSFRKLRIHTAQCLIRLVNLLSNFFRSYALRITNVTRVHKRNAEPLNDLIKILEDLSNDLYVARLSLAYGIRISLNPLAALCSSQSINVSACTCLDKVNDLTGINLVLAESLTEHTKLSEVSRIVLNNTVSVGVSIHETPYDWNIRTEIVCIDYRLANGDFLYLLRYLVSSIV